VKAVLRAELLKADAEGVDLEAARAKVRAVEAIEKLLIQYQRDSGLDKAVSREPRWKSSSCACKER